MLERLRQAKRVALSVLLDKSESYRAKVVNDPALERSLAKDGVVPQRCGLCKFFDRKGYAEYAAANAPYEQAAAFLGPVKMAGVNTGPIPEAPEDPIDSLPEPKPATPTYGKPSRASDEALKLRPALTESFNDYGGCTFYGIALWGFEEHPAMPMPDDKPCSKWA